MKKTLLATVFALAATVTIAGTAHADLIIKANGVQVGATDTSNSYTNFSGTIGNFNINNIGVSGVTAYGGSGEIFDLGTLDIDTTGTGGALTLDVIETNLTTPAPVTIAGLFTGIIANATVTRAFYLDTTNAGLTTTLMGSTTTGAGSVSYLAGTLPALYSITEEIVITPTGAGAKLSSDDSLSVPEPISLSLFGASLVGLGLARRRKNKAA
jgi:hypothetical protein